MCLHMAAWVRRKASLTGLCLAAPHAILAVATLSLAACAAPTSYMGVSLQPGAAASQIQSLARAGLSGDKHAQLALGIAYEEGKGVIQDLKKARKLYRAAAAPSGGTTYIYVPATRKGGKGYVAPVDLGPKVVGLVEARERLGRSGKCSSSVSSILKPFTTSIHRCGQFHLHDQQR
jgi:hypothetical protein